MFYLDSASQTDHESISELGELGEEVLARMRQTGRPLIFTQDGRDSAVLIDIAHYERLRDELHALRYVHQAHGDIRAGRVTVHDDAKAHLLARYS